MAAPATKAPADDRFKVVISEAILSYPKLFEPESMNGGPPKFGCTLIPLSEQDLGRLKKAAIARAFEKLGEEKATKLIKAGKLKMPFIKSTEDDVGYPEGSTYIRPRSKNQPGVFSRFQDPERPGKPMRITDPAQMYPGAIVSASVVAIYYDQETGKGITFALNGVQFIRDGERLAGSGPSEDDFSVDETVVGLADVESDTDANADETEDAPAPPARKSASKRVKVTEETGEGGEDLSDLIG